MIKPKKMWSAVVKMWPGPTGKPCHDDNWTVCLKHRQALHDRHWYCFIMAKMHKLL